MPVDERTFAAEIAGWVTEFLNGRPDLPFDRAVVEEHVQGTARRHDFRLYRRHTIQPVLTGEIKMPDSLQGNHPLNAELVEDALSKAFQAGVRYCFTWNVRQFVLFDSHMQGVPFAQRNIEGPEHVIEASVSDDVRQEHRREAIREFWGTFQDRLVSEMRLAEVSTIEQANEVLRDFIPRFNRQFGVTPAQPGSAYRQLNPSTCLDAVLCFKYIRTVANDNTVQFDGATIQLLPDSLRASYAQANVHVQERLDGSIVVAYQGRTLTAVPAPDGPVQLRARNGRRANDHSPAEVAGSASNGAHTYPVGAERRNGAKGPQDVTPRPQDTKRPGRSRTPAPDHPWRRMRLT